MAWCLPFGSRIAKSDTYLPPAPGSRAPGLGIRDPAPRRDTSAIEMSGTREPGNQQESRLFAGGDEITKGNMNKYLVTRSHERSGQD